MNMPAQKQERNDPGTEAQWSEETNKKIQSGEEGIIT